MSAPYNVCVWFDTLKPGEERDSVAGPWQWAVYSTGDYRFPSVKLYHGAAFSEAEAWEEAKARNAEYQTAKPANERPFDFRARKP